MQNTMLDSAISSNSQELLNASSAIKLFENPLFKVRVIMRCSDPWFVAKDVADCIEHSNVSKMCELCRDKDKIVIGMDEIATNDLLVTNMTRELLCISESGLYRILAKCNLPKCEPFESWVFDEVLPSIRKTGSYGVPQISRKDQLFLAIIHSESEEERAYDLKELAEINKQEVKALTAERDEAIRTKYHFVEGRDAKVCGELGGLRTQNEALRKQIGDSKTYKAAKAIPWLSEYFNTRNRGLYNALAHKLKKVEADMTSEFAHIMIDDSQYGQIKAYHVAVIEKLHEMVQTDEEFMKDYRKDVSPKTKNA